MGRGEVKAGWSRAPSSWSPTSDVRERDGLTLPLAEAVVVEVGDAATETLADGTFEAVLVDRERLDLAWLDASAAALRRAVAPGGRVLVALGPTSPEPDSGERVDDLAAASAPAPAVDAFGWRGLTTVNGRPSRSSIRRGGAGRPAFCGTPRRCWPVAVPASVGARGSR